MPELPEVESFRRLAERALVGHTIASVFVADDKLVFEGASPKKVAALLKGRRVEAAHRRGKQLWLALDERPWPVFHFGMTGSFVSFGSAAEAPAFAKLILVKGDGTRFAFINKRRLGRVRFVDDPPSAPPVSELGFDPLLDPPTAAALARALRGKKAPVKAMLLDQSFAAGVGNWVADEVLYQARIAPKRPAGSLDEDEVKALRQSLVSVVKKAVAVDADAERFPRTWLFHARWGKAKGARTARGETIAFDVVGGRTTAWVPSVQR